MFYNYRQISSTTGQYPVAMFVLTVTIMPELNECVYGKILEVDGGGFPARHVSLREDNQGY